MMVHRTAVRTPLVQILRSGHERFSDSHWWIEIFCTSESFWTVSRSRGCQRRFLDLLSTDPLEQRLSAPPEPRVFTCTLRSLRPTAADA